MSNLENKTEITLERTLEEVAYVAFGRVTDVMSLENGGVTLKDSDELPDEVRAAVAEVKITETVAADGTVNITKSVKMHNKTPALAMLAKFYGIDNDFNTAVATLKNYGIALVPDENNPTGLRTEVHEIGG